MLGTSIFTHQVWSRPNSKSCVTLVHRQENRRWSHSYITVMIFLHLNTVTNYKSFSVFHCYSLLDDISLFINNSIIISLSLIWRKKIYTLWMNWLLRISSACGLFKCCFPNKLNFVGYSVVTSISLLLFYFVNKTSTFVPF